METKVSYHLPIAALQRTDGYQFPMIPKFLDFLKCSSGCLDFDFSSPPKCFIFFFIFIVVQVQLSPFFPHHSPQPQPSSPSTLDPTPLWFYSCDHYTCSLIYLEWFLIGLLCYIPRSGIFQETDLQKWKSTIVYLSQLDLNEAIALIMGNKILGLFGFKAKTHY